MNVVNSFKRCLILSKKKDYFVFILILLLSGFVWVGLSPFVGVYGHMACDYINFAKSMLDGAVLHKDIIDHKGLYTFVPYLFVCLLQRNGLAAYTVCTFIFGCLLSLSCYLYLAYFNISFKKRCLVVVLFDLIVFVLTPFFQPIPAFTPDNFMIPVVLFLFWYILSDKYLVVSYNYYFLFGLLFGIILWAKYPLLVFFFPFYLYLIVYVARYQTISNVIFIHIACLAGFLVASVPVFIYYGYHNCFDLLFNNYFFLVQPGLSNMRPYVFWGLSYLSLSVLAVILKDKELKITCLSMAMIFSCFLASGSLWTNYTMIILVTLLPVFVVYYSKRTMPRFYVVALIAFLLIGSFSFSIYGYDYIHYYDKSFKTVAKEYDIDNNDLMYLFIEDLGFGLWSESGTYMNQWYPGRLTNTPRGKLLADTQVKYIKNRIPKYVVTYPLTYLGYNTIEVLEDSSYECVDTFKAYGIRVPWNNIFNGTTVCLYRRCD